MNKNEKIEAVLTQLESQATDWAYRRIAPIPLIADYIESKTEHLVVLYYKKHAGRAIVGEICKQVRDALYTE